MTDEPTFKPVQFPDQIPRRAWMLPSLMRKGEVATIRANERGEIVDCPKELREWLRPMGAEPEGTA
jgi:hypothetical protein